MITVSKKSRIGIMPADGDNDRHRANSVRVYAPDSSPISTGKAMSATGPNLSRPNGSSYSSSSSSKFGSNFAKNIPRAGTQASRLGSSSRNSMLGGRLLSPTKSNRSVLNLDRYRYASPASTSTRSYLKPFSDKTPARITSEASRRPTAISSDAETISSASDSGAEGFERPQKKRKFRRGKAPSSSDVSPVKPAPSKHSQPPESPIVISDSGEDSALAMSTDSPFAKQAKRLSNLFHGKVPLIECARALRDCKGNTTQAVSVLGKRVKEEVLFPSAVPSKRLSSTAPSIMASITGEGTATMSRNTSPAVSSSESTASAARLRNALGTTKNSASRFGADISKTKKKKSHKSDNDSGDSDSDSGGGGWGSASDGDRESSKRARAAVKWFNEASKQTLIETIGCSAAQAKIIAGLKPFDSADDADEKLRATKGVSVKLFIDYIDLLASFSVVDSVLEKCEKRAARLEEACSPEATAADPHYLKEKPAGMANDVVLKDYQLDGVNWLSLRYRNETSCILADDMGTGKTCQVIAFLCDLKDRDVKGVSLVVAPSSTIENWSRELKRFGPTLNFSVFAGSQAERRQIRYDIEEDHDNLDVILTSYNSATSASDIRFFKKFGFNACVYDEGHQLKNQNTLNYRHLMQVRAEWRLLLTGTPLQNNLLELMSLLNFIMPRDFKNASTALEAIFKSKGNARDSQLSKARVDRARRMMGPFVLRRLKDKVLKLPPKRTRIEYCDMTPHQAKIYRGVLARTRLELLEQDEESKAARKKKDQSSNILMRLRKGAIHPMMFRTIYTAEKIKALTRDYVKEPQFMDSDLNHLQEDFAINSDAELSQLAAQYPHTRKHQVDGSAWLNSGKIIALQRLINDIRSRGEKLVVFSQFEMALFLLMSALDEMKVAWIAFSGRTKVEERQSVIDEFQTNPEIAVFLLTTKAGGVGVNLTAANWVIMLDQDFNPQNDKQAEDRCWRIGQEKEVTVVKLISRGTIDEDILALGQQKLELAARVSGMETGAGGGTGSSFGDGSCTGASASENTAKSGADGGASAASLAVSEGLLGDDDATQQESTARSLLSKLRDKAYDENIVRCGAAGAGAAGANATGDGDDNDLDIEVL